MNGKLSRWAKVRLTQPEFAALASRAGLNGLTVSAYLRAAVTNDRAQFDAREAVRDLDSRLRREFGAARVDNGPLLMETLLITRELLALRDPQALTRVKAQLAANHVGSQGV